MKIERFEDIISWQKARELVAQVYKIFKTNRDFSFCDQIKRASISICNNIAEGYERRSNNEFKHFLYIAKGSAGEVRSMLYSALDLKYISSAEFKVILQKLDEISKLLSGFIKKL
jgi:four helix bundle protein